MSQRHSSSDLAANQPVPSTPVGEDKIRALLDGFYAEDLRPSFFELLLIRLADPFEKSKKDGFKLSPLWAGLGMFAALALSVFLYFNLGRL